jgi:Subunit ChlI of Mg-chelatase
VSPCKVIQINTSMLISAFTFHHHCEVLLTSCNFIQAFLPDYLPHFYPPSPLYLPRTNALQTLLHLLTFPPLHPTRISLCHTYPLSKITLTLTPPSPLLAEIQCLVGGPAIPNPNVKIAPRRATDGFPLQRLQLICAVIEKRLKLSLWNRDVYLNVVGGLRLSEPAADLAVAVTISSSLVGMKIRAGIAFVGEVGLGGEIRGVRGVDMRVAEALKMGFTTVIVPQMGSKTQKKKINHNVSTNDRNVNEQNSKRDNRGGSPVSDGVIPCSTLFEALTIALDVGSFDDILDKLRSNTKKKKKPSSGNQGESVRYGSDDRGGGRSGDSMGDGDGGGSDDSDGNVDGDDFDTDSWNNGD